MEMDGKMVLPLEIATVHITPEILLLLAEIEEFRGT
jgi:hypothetical protein